MLHLKNRHQKKTISDISSLIEILGSVGDKTKNYGHYNAQGL